MKTITQFLKEAKATPELESIAELIKGINFMDLRKPLEGMFKKKDIDFIMSDMIPVHYRIKTKGKTIIIVSSRYAKKAEIIQDNIAIGYEGS